MKKLFHNLEDFLSWKEEQKKKYVIYNSLMLKKIEC